MGWRRLWRQRWWWCGLRVVVVVVVVVAVVGGGGGGAGGVAQWVWVPSLCSEVLLEGPIPCGGEVLVESTEAPAQNLGGLKPETNAERGCSRAYEGLKNPRRGAARVPSSPPPAKPGGPSASRAWLLGPYAATDS